MSRKFGICLSIIFCCIYTYAQRPKWTYNPPKSGNITYRYIVETGTGGTEMQAKNRAFLNILQTAANSLGVPFDSKIVNEAILNGSNMRIISMENNIPINKVCEYIERFEYKYRVYILCQVAKSGNIVPIYDEFRACDKLGNNTSSLWHSALLPGLGQYEKKQIGKGIAILATEAIFVSSIFYTEKMRKDNMRKSVETTNLDIIKEYRKRADTWELRRNIAIGGAIAVYAFNLLDAALAKGQTKYAFIPDNLELLAYQEGNINQFGIQIKF